MSGDLLERAAAALREQHDGTSSDANTTRDRVLASARRPRTLARRRMRLVVPLAAALVVSTAWAGATGRLQRVSAMLEAVFAGSAHDRAPAPSMPPPLVNDVPPATPVLEPTAPTETASAPRPPAPPTIATKGTATPVATTSAPAVAPRTADDDYRAAHAAQFERKDYATAITAWDRYLAAAPNGPMSIEARYNRAIALVRIGRDAEARTALRPFADGEYGEYRRSEAQALLAMLEKRTRDE